MPDLPGKRGERKDKMKTYYTESDGGCFLFGNKDFSFNLPNGYGDCRNKVIVFCSLDEFYSFLEEKYGKRNPYDVNFKWQTTIKGCFNLYNYDCSNMSPKDIKVRFNGKYSLYLRSSGYEQPILAIVLNG